MKKQTEKKYLMKEWRIMKGHLKAFVKKGEQEDLHHFRVGVKKLRAFLTLADSATKEGVLKKNFKPVSKVFKQAGVIRNAYINQELGKEQPGENTDLMQEQHQLMETSTQTFNADRKQHLARLRKTRRKLTKSIRPISSLHISLYYQQQLKAIAAILTKQLFTDELHTCRKQIKVLIYNYQLVGMELDIPFNESYLEQVQTAIGDWHDNQLAIDLFSAAVPANSDALTAVKNKTTNLKKQTMRLTGNFYERATTVTELPIAQID